MLRFAHQHGARVIVALHLERTELGGRLKPGHDMLLKAAREADADQTVELGPAFAVSLRRGENPYRDVIHPNATGQRLMAEALLPAILRMVPAPHPRQSSCCN